eukprot:4554728-Prymnesium_polylepis.1
MLAGAGAGCGALLDGLRARVLREAEGIEKAERRARAGVALHLGNDGGLLDDGGGNTEARRRRERRGAATREGARSWCLTVLKNEARRQPAQGRRPPRRSGEMANAAVSPAEQSKSSHVDRFWSLPGDSGASKSGAVRRRRRRWARTDLDQKMRPRSESKPALNRTFGSLSQVIEKTSFCAFDRGERGACYYGSLGWPMADVVARGGIGSLRAPC